MILVPKIHLSDLLGAYIYQVEEKAWVFLRQSDPPECMYVPPSRSRWCVAFLSVLFNRANIYVLIPFFEGLCIINF